MKGKIAVLGVLVIAAVSSIPAVRALLGTDTRYVLEGTLVTGPIPLLIDPLSAWFILLINFTFITGALYGLSYMQPYENRPAAVSMHWISYVFTHAGILTVCVVQNSIIFLFAWEVMTLGTFLLVTFDNTQARTIKAGINYLIQSHVAVLLLTVSFVWVSAQAGSYSFEAISRFALTRDHAFSLLLMLIFFTGFGIKAGFVPFHTWLPLAHPAAPSHVSGMMSGVLIKIGIYGILRMILLLNVNYLATGFFILSISVVTGIYGVMLAIVQHNLKRLLAYHSIENIGIIGMGIGIGCIGMGTGNPGLALLGYAGALLHTLNHSLFKSLLFFTAGNISKAVHTMTIDRFGGLIRKMPQTAFLFLIASMAICGLPPFNGFVSEFIIFSGFFNGIRETGFPSVLMFVLAIFGLSLIGGLAILCFTKAFGAIFLGTQRFNLEQRDKEGSWQSMLPLYAIALLILAIGLFPQVFIKMLLLPVVQLTGSLPASGRGSMEDSFRVISRIGLYSLGFISLSGLIYMIRKKATGGRPVVEGPTWGCGYVAPTARMQYTASSFIRNYRKLAEPLLAIGKHRKDVDGVFPGRAYHETHPGDKVEEYLIHYPLRKLRVFMGRFSFLQNGKLQFYILYGMIFIIVLVAVPLMVDMARLLAGLFQTF
jgi:formate hydrogenlyase subunit 3/multisubunit Na+/H+ antiporter MnhD subunit